MQQRTGSFQEEFSKNTFNIFLNNPKINRLRFSPLLSKKVANAVELLTDADRIYALVDNNSLLERTSFKKTELGYRMFDHVSMKYCKGYPF